MIWMKIMYYFYSVYIAIHKLISNSLIFFLSGNDLSLCLSTIIMSTSEVQKLEDIERMVKLHLALPADQ